MDRKATVSWNMFIPAILLISLIVIGLIISNSLKPKESFVAMSAMNFWQPRWKGWVDWYRYNYPWNHSPLPGGNLYGYENRYQAGRDMKTGKLIV